MSPSGPFLLSSRLQVEQNWTSVLGSRNRNWMLEGEIATAMDGLPP